MAYVKQTFIDGTTKLKASHLNNIEQGIVDNETAISSANAKINQVQSSIPTAVTNAVNEEIYEIIDKLTSPFTSTGSIIQCHPVEGYPLDVSVSLEPIQSGSGDPYPAGGGKNLLPPGGSSQTISGVTITSNSDGSVTVNGTASTNITFRCSVSAFELAAGSYVLSGCPSGGSDTTYDLRVQGSGIDKRDFGTGVGLSLESATANLQVIIMIRSGCAVSNITFYPMIRLASITDSTYAPYSNIRPISGHTDCEVVRRGKNLLPKVVSRTQEKNGITLTSYGDGSYRVHGTCTAGGTSISFTTESTAVVPEGAYWHLLNDGTCTNAAFTPKFTDNTSGSLAFSVDNRSWAVSDKYVGQTIKEIGVYVINGETLDITFRPMMCLDDIATSYEPYQGDTYPVEFGQTVYGGTLDWGKDELMAEWAMVTLDESTPVFAWNPSTGSAVIDMSGLFEDKAAIKCSHFKTLIESGGYGNTVVGITNNYAYNQIGFSNPAFKTVDEWKAFFAAQYAAGTPVQIAYKLATPTTIQLTPQDIPALDGTNTVYADAGNVTVNGRIDPDYMNTTVLNRLAALEAAIVSNV